MPNFEDELYNNVVTSSMERVNPGDSLKYEVNYKNTGYRLVEILQITIQVPENTFLQSNTEGGTYDEEKDCFNILFQTYPGKRQGALSS